MVRGSLSVECNDSIDATVDGLMNSKDLLYAPLNLVKTITVEFVRRFSNNFEVVSIMFRHETNGEWLDIGGVCEFASV